MTRPIEASPQSFSRIKVMPSLQRKLLQLIQVIPTAHRCRSNELASMALEIGLMRIRFDKTLDTAHRPSQMDGKSNAPYIRIDPKIDAQLKALRIQYGLKCYQINSLVLDMGLQALEAMYAASSEETTEVCAA